jgi:hypothetical protein
VQHLDELENAADRWSQPTVRALIAETRAALCTADDPHAMRLLVLARQLWTSGRIDFHAARVRLKIAALLLDAEDGVGSEAELAAVDQTATRIGSKRLAGLADTLRRRLNNLSNESNEVQKLKTTAKVSRSARDKQKIRSS